MQSDELIIEVTKKSADMLALAFEHMPGITEKERALLINLGARLYNQGVLDTVNRVAPQFAAALSSQAQEFTQKGGKLND